MKLVAEQLSGLVRNSLSHRADEDGYVTWLRFSEAQLQFYAADSFFDLMSQCSAGVCFDFETTGHELTLECRTVDLNRKVLAQIKGELTFGEILQKLGDTVRKVNQAGSRLDIIQHFDLYVDGHYTDAVRLGNGPIAFCLNNPEHSWRHVRIWLPLYKPLSIRSIETDGELTAVPVNRPRLVALGDSITQGFVAGKPSFCYVAQLAELLDFDALNQGIGNITHDAAILTDWDTLPAPDLVTVAYGTNDWHSGKTLSEINSDVVAFYRRLNAVFPAVPIVVLTPIWREDLEIKQPCGTFADLTGVIRQVASAYAQVRLVDGLSVSPHCAALYSDGWLHPNIGGFSYLAPRLYRAIKGWL